MRIAFLISQSLDSPYGAGRCLPLARQMAAWGHDVHIVALHHDLQTCPDRDFVQDGIHVHYVGQMHVRKVNDTTLYYRTLRLLWVICAATIGMTMQALRLRADVIHLGKPHPQNSLAGLIAARLTRGCSLFLDYDDLEAASNRLSGAWQGHMLAWLETTIPRCVDGVTVHSQFLFDRVVATGVTPSAVHRLPSAVEPARFVVGAEDINQLRSQLNLDGQRTVLYVGTMSLANHPVDLLLHAFAEVARQLCDVTLVLVGGGKDYAKLRGMAKELGIESCCRFVGRVTAATTPVFYHLADVSVDPVEDNDVARARWPLKIIESMAAGTPIITGEIGDRNEMLGHGVAGLLVPPGNATALAAAILVVLSDQTLQERLRAGCASRITHFYTESVACQLLAYYSHRDRLDGVPASARATD